MLGLVILADYLDTRTVALWVGLDCCRAEYYFHQEQQDHHVCEIM